MAMRRSSPQVKSEPFRQRMRPSMQSAINCRSRARVTGSAIGRPTCCAMVRRKPAAVALLGASGSRRGGARLLTREPCRVQLHIPLQMPEVAMSTDQLQPHRIEPAFGVPAKGLVAQQVKHDALELRAGACRLEPESDRVAQGTERFVRVSSAAVR